MGIGVIWAYRANVDGPLLFSWINLEQEMMRRNYITQVKLRCPYSIVLQQRVNTCFSTSKSLKGFMGFA